jgi:Flagellar biosynthesis/type III secretory pathway lipoprotein
MVILFVSAGTAALAVLGGLHWYAWRRLVRDTTAGPGAVRRAGTAVFVAGPLLMIGAVASERAGAPFWLQRTLSWPGFLWMAVALYLVLALLAGEALRPVLRRAGERRAAARRDPDGVTSPAVTASDGAGSHEGALPLPGAAPPRNESAAAGPPPTPTGPPAAPPRRKRRSGRSRRRRQGRRHRPTRRPRQDRRARPGMLLRRRGVSSSRVSWAVRPPPSRWGPSATGRTAYCAAPR